MFADFRYALRQLFKNPGFAAICILTLSLGIGANTAIFSVVNAVLLKPLPFPAPDELLAVGMTNPNNGGTRDQLASFSYADYFDYRKQNHTLAQFAIYRQETGSLQSANGAQSVDLVKCSGNFFDALGVKPILGRGFTQADELAGGGPGGLKVLLAYDFWKKQFGGDREIVGRKLELDRRSYLVAGVLPQHFQFPIDPEPVEIYRTIADDAVAAPGEKPLTEERGSHMMQAIARVKPGLSTAQVEADLGAIADALAKQYPETNTNFGVVVKPLRENMVGDVRTALYVLFGAVICVLLIANANVANLLLARASVRAREIALRAALGASRGRIVRQLLTESVLLSALGGFFGLLLAVWGTTALVATIPENIPRIGEIRLDGLVLFFTLLVSLTTGIVFGLVPAWQASHVDLNSALKTGSRTGGGGEQKARLRNGLVMAQIALALVLLVCAGLLIQSFARLGQVATGMRPDHLLTARVGLPTSAYPKAENIAGFFDKLLPSVRALSGVEAASAIVPLPLSSSNMVTDFDIAARPLPEGQRAAAPVRIIASDYFSTVGVPLLSGRSFDAHDNLTAAPVVIVNEFFAKKYFPGQNALGQRITPGFSADPSKPKVREIVGIVGNVKHRSLRYDDTPEMYLPLGQIPFEIMTLVVRTRVADPATLATAIRAQVQALDAGIPLTNVRVFDEYISRSLARPRFNALLLSIFAGTALFLTAIGIYGVLAYSVSQRTQEIGIRMALGAEQSSIFRLIVGQAMILVGVSVAFGLVGAFGATRLLNSLLFGVGASDPLTFLAIVLLVAVVAFLAAWLPARRAARVNPIVALRAE